MISILARKHLSQGLHFKGDISKLEGIEHLWESWGSASGLATRSNCCWFQYKTAVHAGVSDLEGTCRDEKRTLSYADLPPFELNLVREPVYGLLIFPVPVRRIKKSKFQESRKSARAAPGKWHIPAWWSDYFRTPIYLYNHDVGNEGIEKSKQRNQNTTFGWYTSQIKNSWKGSWSIT